MVNFSNDLGVGAGSDPEPKIMTMEDPTVIDITRIGKDGKVYLVISDAWEWGDLQHIQLLQEKINAYLGVIEHGQIYDEVPEAKPDNLVIQIVYKHEPDELGRSFLDHAGKIIAAEGIGFIHSTNAVDLDTSETAVS